MLELVESRVALEDVLQQAQAGAGCGDGELRVQRDDYQVSHAVPLDLTSWQKVSGHKLEPYVESCNWALRGSL